jgi:hypothetical protein
MEVNMRMRFSSQENATRVVTDLSRFLSSRGFYFTQSQYRHAVALTSGYKDWEHLLATTKEVGPSSFDITEKEMPWWQGMQSGCLMGALNLPPSIARLAVSEVDMTDKPPVKPAETQVSVWIMEWEESERGWGVRPDGFSIHPSQENYREFLADYWAKMPNETPDEYERPAWDKLIHYILPSNHTLVEKMLAGSRRIYRGMDKSGDNVFHQVQVLISDNSEFHQVQVLISDNSEFHQERERLPQRSF